MTLLLALTTFLVAWLACGRLLALVVPFLRERGVIDEPNQRSSHVVPTPRGGGLAIVVVMLPVIFLVAYVDMQTPWLALSLGYVVLGYLSWRDDRGGLSPALRLLIQCVVVGLTLLGLESEPVLPLPVPMLVDRLIIGLCWVWFINLYNFMDGIDGIAGVEAASIALGAWAIAILSGAAGLPPWVPAALAGAAIGFLGWNWSPARVFMGDVGSVPMGYLLGFLLILLAQAGALAAAVILPLYFVCDATITLLRRIAAGKKPWQAHREHFYQRAVASGRSHAQVSSDVALLNLALVGLAISTIPFGWLPLVPAILFVGLLLRRWQWVNQ